MNPAQRLILGLEGPILTDSMKRLLADKQIGGVILFDRNARDRSQLKALIEQIRDSCTTVPFVAIDFEGGRVRRMDDIFHNLDEPIKYQGDLERLYSDCREVSREFSEIGLNLNFAPVADLSYTPLNPALKDRTFSDDPNLVAEYCIDFIKGFAANGIQCCLKHFPGLGSAVNDPHDKTAISCIAKEKILANDFIPYKAGISAGASMIMTSHVLISDIDEKISTFSRITIDLARFIGFDSVIITDDMTMGGAQGNRSLPEKVLETLVTGHDMALICHEHDKHEEIVGYLEENISALIENGHTQALERIANVKSSLSKR
ncbi:MAG: glycoside hydrolase family 3 protein [candidate division Zixibacteria bacterium]|nr:glycoside hydrolase family 3 protein [candidate division Zixibacteria bacterium]